MAESAMAAQKSVVFEFIQNHIATVADIDFVYACVGYPKDLRLILFIRQMYFHEEMLRWRVPFASSLLSCDVLEGGLSVSKN